jgi:transposase-like protein
MNCPHCHSTSTTQLQRITGLGYAVFCCRDCRRSFNERTGTEFNFLEFPTDIVFQVLLCRLRYKLSVRDVAEFFLVQGFQFTHETVRDWEERFAPICAEELRAKRKGKVGKIWHVDETYIRVKGKWCCLYRAMGVDGNLVDSMLSQKRDMKAAKTFFAQAQEVAELAPERVITDGHTSYPQAIAEVLGPEVAHELWSCLANPIEQDHRGVKQRYYPTLRFGAFESAKRFCQAYDEVRNFFRPRSRMGDFVSLSARREHFLNRVDALQMMFQVA